MRNSVWTQAETEARTAVEACLKAGDHQPATIASHPAYLPCVRKALALMASVTNPTERAAALTRFASAAAA